MISLDSNHFLTLSDPLSTHKEYTLRAAGGIFTSFNKSVVIRHKKNYKAHDRNTVGSTMSLVACYDRPLMAVPTIRHDHIESVLSMFTSYDEQTGLKNHFFPFSHINKVRLANILFGTLEYESPIEEINYTFVHTGIEGAKKLEERTELGDIVCVLYLITILYGDLLIRMERLEAIKIYFPLFGQYRHYDTVITGMLEKLRAFGIYSNYQTLTWPQADTLQVTSTDYELTYLFAHLHDRVAIINQIATMPERNKLLEFLKQNWLDESLKKKIELWTLKHLEV